MKLKTLKDFINEYQKSDKITNEEKRIRTLALMMFRKEAIKWYKHLATTNEDNVFVFLETFFNIKEEDMEPKE